MRELLVVIPAYNAARSVAELIDGIRHTGVDGDILVVDDGSSDRTSEIAVNNDVRCIKHDRNRGKGAALRTGFAEAIAGGYRIAVTIDADLQHDPADLPALVELGRSGREVVLAQRKRCRPMPYQRRLSNFMASLMSSWLAHRKLEDAQCGLRLIPVALLRELRVNSSHYQAEVELLIRACRHGWPIRFLPIDTIYNGSSSHIKGGRDTIRFLKMAFESIFW
jgi:glycosyltransferase involved in cell wall biosynthesis